MRRFVTVLATAGLLAASCAGGDERSVEAFCSEVTDGAARMTENVATAGDDAGSLLVAALANMGEYSRILDRMAATAPDEIRTETEAAAELWDKQAEAAGDAISNPLAALGSALMSSVLASSQIEALDAYTAANCNGIQLFAAPAPTSGSPAPAASQPAMCRGLAGTDLPVETSTTKFGSLLDTIADTIAEEEPSAAAAAKSLNTAFAESEGSDVFERLARARWNDGKVTGWLNTVEQAVADVCDGDGLFDEGWAEDFALVGPQRVTGGVRVGNYERDCGEYVSSKAIALNLVYVDHCGNDTGEFVVNLESGEVLPIPACDGDDCYNIDTFLGDSHTVRVRKVVTPASGLNPELTRYEVRVAAFGDATTKTILSVEGTVEDRKSLAVQSVFGDRIAVLEYGIDASGDRTQQLVIIDVEGTELARWDAQDPVNNAEDAVTGSFFADTSSRDAPVIDLLTLTQIPLPAVRFTYADRCWDTISARAYGDQDYFTLRRVPGGTVVKTPFVVSPGDSGQDPTVEAIAFVGGILYRDGDLVAEDGAGTELWRIDRLVASAFHVFGGLPYVVNPEGELIALDPATGAEAGDVNSHVAAFLDDTSLRENVAYDHASGTVAYVTDDGLYSETVLQECKLPG